MKTGKNARQELIIKLIKENSISTQEELTRLVKEAGFVATQATCSRDIKELGIIKVTLPDNETKYAVPGRTGEIAPGRLLSVFSNSIVSVNNAMNIVVIKTLPGMAQAAASAFDSLHFNNVVGTIAGDDTIFAASVGIKEAEELVESINNMIYSD